MASERQHRAEENAASGLTLEELEDAGLAAGIEPDHIRAAAADLLRPERASIQRSFLGMPVEVRRTRIVQGSIDSMAWDEIVRKARHVFAKEGIVTETSRVREWVSEAKEEKLPVRLIAEPEGDETRITIERKTWPQAIGFAMGSAVNLAMGLLLLITSIVSSAGNSDWIAGSIMLGVGMLLATGAIVGLRHLNRNQSRRFENLLDYIEQILPVAELQRDASPVSSSQLGTADETPRLSLDETIDEEAPKESIRRASKSRS
jgi:hypothetical protein